MRRGRGENERRPQSSATDITNHALHQQTITNVLSEEAYANYQARQAESLAFRQQAARDLVVASLDIQLWLSEKQRKSFEQAAAKLPAPPANTTAPAPAKMVTELFEHFFRTDRKVLSPWQARQFEEFSTGLKRGEWENRRGR